MSENAPDARTGIDRHIAAAARSIEAAEQTISKAAKAKGNSRPKDFAKKILNATNQIIPVAEAVAVFHPAAQAAVGIFKAITKLETERTANDDRIALIHHSMSLAMFSVRHLAKVPQTDEFEDELSGRLSKLKDSMDDFGNFVALYYKNKLSVFRVLRSAEYKERLQGYADTFNDSRGEINDFIRTYTAVTVADIHTQMGDVGGTLAKILATIGEDTAKEQAASRTVQRYGGAEHVIFDDALLAEVAKQTGDKVNQSTKAALREGLDTLLSENYAQFSKKVDGAQIQIEEQVKQSRDMIMNQLTEGPHELLEDEDIKEVWRSMKWRNSVKCRLFVDAIHDHYSQKFARHYAETGQIHPDQWTLQLLTKVMFHAAIGDAIDEDSSGFVSVHEVNHFLVRRPQHWSTPEWLAFWAQGWSQLNDRYREEIYILWEEIQTQSATVLEDNKETIDGIISFVTLFLDALIDVKSDDDSDIIDTSLDDEPYADELAKLYYEYSEIEEAKLLGKLKTTLIDAPSALISALGQPRIELSLMPLLYVWLRELRETVQIAHNVDLEDQKSVDVEQLLVTITTISFAFNSRMTELIRVWRQQRMSVTSQMMCFCGGIFASWYEESQKSDNAFKRLIMAVEGDSDDEDEEGNGEASVAKSPPANPRLKGDVDQKIQQVWMRMNGIDTQLGKIESLLLALASGGAGAVKTPARGGADAAKAPAQSGAKPASDNARQTRNIAQEPQPEPQPNYDQAQRGGQSQQNEQPDYSQSRYNGYNSPQRQQEPDDDDDQEQGRQSDDEAQDNDQQDQQDEGDDEAQDDDQQDEQDEDEQEDGNDEDED